MNRTRTSPIAVAKLLAAVCWLHVAVVACDPTAGSAPPPFAVQPVKEELTPNDPQGTPAPADAPPMFTKIIKFRIPTGTVFDVSVNGWIVREQSLTQCGDDGCYAVLARNDAGNGQTTWVIQIWPQSPARFANTAEFQITDVSLNASATGSQLASKALRLIFLRSVSDTGPNPFAVRGRPEWASLRQVDALKFRTIGESSAADALAYYQAVDPPQPGSSGARLTLTDWKRLNGFGTDDSQDDAKATYFNAGDLGFGRSMHMKAKPNGDIAYYVSNYPTVEDARRRTNLIATVAMEYTPDPQSGQRIMKFFVYGDNDQRVGFADLDGNGPKNVPNLCIICHGNRKFTGSPDVGGRFLPFDLNSFQYSATIDRINQEAEFKKLNLGILSANPSAAERALIQAWYNSQPATPADLANPVQKSDAVPTNWGGPEAVYLRVVRPSCRSCHITREPGLDFGTFGSFNNYGTHNNVCTEMTMPNAKVTYERFWLQGSRSGNNQVRVLNEAGVTGWGAGVLCPTL